MVCAWRRFRPGCPYLLPAGGGGHSPACRAGKASAVLWLSRGNMQTRLQAGLSVPLQGGGVAPASIQTRQCFRQHANQASGRAVCSTARGGGSTSQHSNQTMLPAGVSLPADWGQIISNSPQWEPASQPECTAQFFFLDLKGLGLAHRPGCVPGAASSRAVLTNCLLRGGGHHQPAFKPGELPAGLFMPADWGIICCNGSPPARMQTR